MSIQQHHQDLRHFWGDLCLQQLHGLTRVLSIPETQQQDKKEPVQFILGVILGCSSCTASRIYSQLTTHKYTAYNAQIHTLTLQSPHSRSWQCSAILHTITHTQHNINTTHTLTLQSPHSRLWQRSAILRTEDCRCSGDRRSAPSCTNGPARTTGPENVIE